jgi:hypothetical protein
MQAAEVLKETGFTEDSKIKYSDFIAKLLA